MPDCRLNKDPLLLQILDRVGRCPLSLKELVSDLKSLSKRAKPREVYSGASRLCREGYLELVLCDHPEGPFYALPGYLPHSLVIDESERAEVFQGRDYATYFSDSLE